MTSLRQLMLDRHPKRQKFSERIDRHCEIVLERFRDSAPKSLVRIGEGEADILEEQDPAAVARGIAEAVKHADVVGVPGIPPSKATARILRTLRERHQVEPNPSVYINVYLFQLAPELIGRLAAGRRVLWITSGAERIVRNLDDPEFRDFYGLHDIQANHYINAAPGRLTSSPLPAYVTPEQAYADIQRQLAETPDFDLALIGAGAVGKLVCHHIKTTLGKHAVDVGLPMSALQGDHRTKLRPGGFDYIVWGGAALARRNPILECAPDQAPSVIGRATRPTPAPDSSPAPKRRLTVNRQIRDHQFFHHNWEQCDRECEWIVEMFHSPGAKSLIRLGDGELDILKSPKTGWARGRPSGMTAPMLAHAVRHADCIGLPGDNRPEQHQNEEGQDRDECWKAEIIQTLRDDYHTPLHQPKISANLFLLAPETVGRLAAGKRVLWITFGAEKIVNNLNDPAFRDYYALNGIADNCFLNLPPPAKSGASPYPESVGPEQLYVTVQQQLARAPDFDLALIGGGVAGKLICWYIKTILGKHAADIGVLMSALQGLRNREELKRDAMRDNIVWDPAHPLKCRAAPTQPGTSPSIRSYSEYDRKTPLRQLIRERRPELDWAQIQRDEDSVFEMFRQPGAKSLVRAGTGELKILQTRTPESLAPELARAIQQADCIGLPEDQAAPILDTLREHYQAEPSQSLRVASSLFLLAPNLIGRLAAGRRVLWITSDAEKIIRNLENLDFRNYYELHGIAANLSINAEPGTGALPESGDARQAELAIRQQLDRAGDFDLAFVGVGALGKPICQHIKSTLGKTAIDIGFMMSAFTGLRNRKKLVPGRPYDYVVWDPSFNPRIPIPPEQRIKSKYIVSFTTSPTRIHKCGEMLRSILEQSRQPDEVILNIPDIFSRTGETYTIPEWIENEITVNRCGRDWGPATKIVPTVELLKKRGVDPNGTRILYLDDDFRYPRTMIESLEKEGEDEDCVWCASGRSYVNYKMLDTLKHGDEAGIAEGFMGVCVRLTIFKDDFIGYMDAYTRNPITYYTDDLVLSNYYHKVGVPIKMFATPEYHNMHHHGGELEHGRQKDALSRGADGATTGNTKQYRKAIEEMERLNDRHLKIYFIGDY